MQSIRAAMHTRTQPQRTRRRRRDIDFHGKTVHMIGVGGCGMHAAARLLMHCGATIVGSDRSAFRGIGSLTEFGAKVYTSQRASNIRDRTDLVVYSAAVPESNEELAAARGSGCRVIKYAELLGELMRVRTGVAVAGTHGKSTTTALCAHLFRTAGLDPSYVIGANVPQLGGGSGVGMGEHFLVEACEFDRSFLHLRPKQAAILNVEADHLDCYADVAEIIDAFGAFAGNVASDGLIIARHADVNVAAAVGGAQARVETFGFEPGSTWRATNLELEDGRYGFDVTYEDLPLFRTSLDLAGLHNVTNALAATALAWNAGANRDALAEALRSFRGVDRRMSLHGRIGGVAVVDDYAHHPTEIRVTLAAVRDRYAPNRVVVVFQPHQHSRTRILMDQFAKSFDLADEVIVPDIYGSRDTELDIKRTGARTLATRLRRNGVDVRYIPTLDDIAAVLTPELLPGDLVVTMGAGDVWKLADALVERLYGLG